MKPTYFLGLDAAKHKMRATLCQQQERVLFEKDLPVTATGLHQLLSLLKQHVKAPLQLLILVEATGVLHLHWSAALSKAGYQVAVINPLMARRLYHLENSIRDNKTDAVDARGLCAIGLREGEKLLTHYRFLLKPEQFALQRLQSVRKALRSAFTNLKKTYGSLLDLSFPELGGLLELDGVGIRKLLAEAPTPAAIARKRLASLQKNWMLRPKAAQLKAMAGQSVADPELAAAAAPALQRLLETLSAMEEHLGTLDQQIAKLATASADPKTKSLVESLPGFGSINAAKVVAYLPAEILHSGNNRKVAARLQAFMGNDPRVRQSGQWKGHTKMSKRGVEILRTAFFQSALSASQTDPELRSFYLRKRAQGKKHEVAISHLMRILTRRLVAVLRSSKQYCSNYQLILQNVA
jgi:transposase